MTGKSVLISGLGIAGPALAHWLLRYGFSPTLVERAPAPRAEGYVIDFWGVGYDIVDEMGLLPEVLAAGYQLRELRLVGSRGERVGGFDAGVFGKATNGRYTSLPRGALSAILYRSIAQRVETLFGNSIIALEQDSDGVLAHFERESPRRFDLVVGADGLHSAVRKLVFGEEPAFERSLGYTVAAFETVGYRPRDEDVYVSHAAPGRQVARFSMRDDRTMFLLVVADPQAQAVDPGDTAANRRYIHERFASVQWECPQILAEMDRCDEVYFDRVSQIRMDRWSKGRVALVGDAAFAPSLLAGQGSALAIIGAYVLAGELSRAARPEDAFAAYEATLRPFLVQKQDAAERFASSFAPATQLGISLRNLITKAMGFAPVAKLAIGTTLRDDIELPNYARPHAT